MKIPRIVLKTGLLLSGCTLILFFLVQYFLKTDRFFQLYDFQYYRTALVINSFVLTLLYSLVRFRMLFFINQTKKVNWLINFRYSFMARFIGGLSSISVMFIYLNYIDPKAIAIFTNQQLDWMLSLGTDADEVKKMSDSLEASNSRDVNTFSFKKVYGIYLPGIIFFDLFVSFILALFYKR